MLSELEQLSNEEIARARTKLYEGLQRNCRCYVNERGELMGEPKGREK